MAAGDDAWLDLVARRFPGCLSQDHGQFRIDYRQRGGCPDGLVSPLAARREPSQTKASRHGFELTGETFSARVDLDAGRAWLTGPCALYPLDALLRHLLPLLASPGLIVHAAALAEGGRGWLASGPSGAGKSTLAALLGKRALCDGADRAGMAIRRSPTLLAAVLERAAR